MTDVSPPAIRRHLLVNVYGESEAASVQARLEQVLARRRRPGHPTGSPGDSPSNAEVAPTGTASTVDELWGHRDVWMITYADQFRSGSEAPLKTLATVLDDHLAGLVNGVHILPFYPWSSDDGFSITDYSRVDDRYGTWADISALGNRFRLMFDAVINHASAQSEWFRRFLEGRQPYDNYFRCQDPETDISEVVRPRTHPLLTRFETAGGPRWVWTTFSADQVDLDYSNPDVLVTIIDQVLDYIDRGASIIRLDAIGFLWKDPTLPSIHLPETHRIVQLLRSCVDDVAPGTILISETNVPHTENLSYFNDHPSEVHGVYQFALPPLTAHAALTSDTSHLVAWAVELSTHDHASQTFLNFLASHDGIGVRPVEEILTDEDVDVLVEATIGGGGQISYRSMPDGSERPYELNTTWFDLMSWGVDETTALSRHLATHALLLALPGIPAIYAHSFFGSSNDTDGYARTGHNRTLNRQRFDADEAFATSWRAVAVLEGLRHHIDARTANPAYHPNATCQVNEPVHGSIRVDRSYRGHHASCIVNFNRGPITVDGHPIEPYGVAWW